MVQPNLMDIHAPGSASPGTERNPRVLAVDDQRDALRLLQIRLENAGMECFTSSDGTAALQFLEKELVDLTTAVIAINSWNRASIAFRVTPQLTAAKIAA